MTTLEPHDGQMPGISVARLFKIPRIRQDRGTLLVGQFPDDLPFTPVRFFMISDVPADEARGQHAHRTCHQLLIALTGSVEVQVWDASGAHQYRLDDPSEVLHIPPMTYGTQRSYSTDAVLLVLASHQYSVEDYMDSFEEFCASTGYIEQPDGT